MIIPGTTSVPSYRRMMIFIDGENLVFNYQNTLKNNPQKLKDMVSHLQDVYVWHPNTVKATKHEVIRANYYTFAVGSDEQIASIANDIKQLSFAKDGRSILPFYLRPHVFKKDRRDRKSKGVDIQMTVDILTNVFNNNLDTVLLVTGDGDFLPIIHEIVRHGKQVYLASFSSGLNAKLLNVVDDHINLDKIYFDL
ncbi:MAG: hypothetical protein K0S26_1412 [Bacteroidota bacterium]|jgi:uncharacterized LabA/DUF88 family protein|nr:hypothetical protein [Bacteroidota bacterium]